MAAAGKVAALAGQRMADEMLPRMPVSIQGGRDNIHVASVALPDINRLCRLLKWRSRAVINSCASMPRPLSYPGIGLPGQTLAKMHIDCSPYPSPDESCCRIFSLCSCKP